MAIEHFEKKKRLSENYEDVLFVSFDVQLYPKKLISFCVIQFCNQFDTAHGCCHVHSYYKSGNFREELFNYEINFETLHKIERDILENWQKYKKWYFEKQQRQQESLI